MALENDTFWHSVISMICDIYLCRYFEWVCDTWFFVCGIYDMIVMAKSMNEIRRDDRGRWT